MQSHLLSIGRRTNSLQWSARLFGIAGTLLLHVLMIQVGTLGMVSSKKRPPEETGPGASALITGATAALTLVLIPQPAISEAESLEQLASAGLAAASAAIQIVSPNPELAIDESLSDADSEDPMTSGDPSARSLLFGRYTDQLTARIERAWLKPRSPVEHPSMPSWEEESASTRDHSGLFRCVVRITQDHRGSITEIELVRCADSPAWQQSLVNAIQASAPLPAPPNPTVFSSVLMMSFEGREYRNGISERGYEPAPAASADRPLGYRSTM